MTTLPLTTQISQNSQKTRRNRVLISQFGMGFAQFAKDGPNSQYDAWSISYDNLSSTDRSTVQTFYETVGSDQWFYWTANGDSSQKKWRIEQDSYNEEINAGDSYTISFNIFQVFDLGV